MTKPWLVKVGVLFIKKRGCIVLTHPLFMLREEEANPPLTSCIEVVNALRNAPDVVFHEWKNSEVAKLFENHGYKNLKKSGGFWF